MSKSSIYAYSQMDSFSHVRDSVTASKWLIKIDPYYLLQEWGNTTEPDTFLQKFHVTAFARKDYMTQYDRALNEMPTDYRNFERMGKEDQQIRAYLSKCGDMNTCSKLQQQMQYTDSIHAAYLYSYVKANGWPDIKHGSMYATLIAIHDHPHHNFYMPYMIKAAKEGQVSIMALELINHYIKEAKEFEYLDRMLKKGPYIAFDISDILKLQMPACLPRIQNFLYQSCDAKFKFCYIFECADFKYFLNWFNVYEVDHNGNDIMTRFQRELQPSCPKKIFDSGVWTHHWKPAERTRLMLYAVFEDEPMR
ncbi:MAG: hypothetical protein ACTHJ0_12600 [Flavipsychrobacter sp.]